MKVGSRVWHQMYAGGETSIRSFRTAVEPRAGRGVRGHSAGEQINEAIERAQRFLTLASLVTVILSAIAAAMAARRRPSPPRYRRAVEDTGRPSGWYPARC